jgi:hypothetical protein
VGKGISDPGEVAGWEISACVDAMEVGGVADIHPFNNKIVNAAKARKFKRLFLVMAVVFLLSNDG